MPSAAEPVGGLLFATGFCMTFGLELEPLRDRVGDAVPCSSGVRRGAGQPRACDAFGHQLALATQQGDHWRIIHDMMLYVMHSWLRRCDVRFEEEPQRLFADLLPPRAAPSGSDDAETQRRRGIVPDTRVVGMPPPRRVDGRRHSAADRRIFDLKMLHGGGDARYGRPRLQPLSRGAVQVRADEVARDYEREARGLDQAHHDVRAADVQAGTAQPGPVLRRLREFAPCDGLVWGAYAEASGAVHELLSYAATRGAEQRWRRMGARSPTEARGLLVGAMRREWGLTAWLCQARLVAWRLSTVGMSHLPPRAPPRPEPVGPAAEQQLDDVAALAQLWLEGLAPAVFGGPRAA